MIRPSRGTFIPEYVYEVSVKRSFYIKSTFAAAPMASTFMVSVAFAAPYEKSVPGGFPFELELDTESCERLCYAGHPSSGVSYVKGYAVSPQTALSISVASGADATVSMDDLSMEISLIYENESNTASAEETVRAYEEGDLEPGAWYPLFEETNIDNLAERDRLYSGSLSSIKVELEYKGMRNERSDKTVYLQVCSQEELNDLVNASEGF